MTNLINLIYHGESSFQLSASCHVRLLKKKKKKRKHLVFPSKKRSVSSSDVAGDLTIWIGKDVSDVKFCGAKYFYENFTAVNISCETQSFSQYLKIIIL